MSSLPNPRQFLTDLISSLPPHLRSAEGSTSSQGNILQNLALSDRHVLTTLHVLFPSFLLPSLDLLDRGLVSKIIKDAQSSGPSEKSKGASSEVEVHPSAPGTPLGIEASGSGFLNGSIGHGHIYLVQSAQENRGKHLKLYGTGNTYIVRLQAWNCTCAAFTFAAFPGNTSHENHFQKNEGNLEWGMPVGTAVRNQAGEFGGLSVDGTNGENVPCCKHLLACLLAERWESVLGSYVKTRTVDRDEMAGLGGGV